MHLQGQTTTFQMRLEISEYATAGLNNARIAKRVGCSIWTVHKWRRRSMHQDRVGFKLHMGRPTTGPLSTFPKELNALFRKEVRSLIKPPSLLKNT